MTFEEMPTGDQNICAICAQPLASDVHTDLCKPVARIMKIALPDNAKIAKEAKECMQECVSEFISFITSEGVPPLRPYMQQLTDVDSIREVPAGKAQDGERRGHPVRHDFTRLRKL